MSASRCSPNSAYAISDTLPPSPVRALEAELIRGRGDLQRCHHRPEPVLGNLDLDYARRRSSRQRLENGCGSHDGQVILELFA